VVKAMGISFEKEAPRILRVRFTCQSCGGRGADVPRLQLGQEPARHIFCFGLTGFITTAFQSV
jgi:hypothetical protein